MASQGEASGDRKVGVLLVGALGMTGIAVIASVRALKAGVLPERYGTTGHPAFASAGFLTARAIEVGGWDYWSRSVDEMLSVYGHLPCEYARAGCSGSELILPGLWTEGEYPMNDEQRRFRQPGSLGEGASMVADDIAMFRERSGCRCIIVVFVGTPARHANCGEDVSDAPLNPGRRCSSGVMYAVGAANAGAHFVDFTPSRTLEQRALWKHAEERGVQVAGRDGSTGQTMLKVTLAEMFERRGIEVNAWYSTNLIGNRDGLVLSHPEFNGPKLADKTNALRRSSNRFHKVSIEYCPPWGDAKEAWDAIECESWMSAPISLRVNWRGHDSQLAAAMIIDLVRMVEHGAGKGWKGLQPQLGFFFKRPFLREETSISERWSELVSSYAA